MLSSGCLRPLRAQRTGVLVDGVIQLGGDRLIRARVLALTDGRRAGPGRRLRHARAIGDVETRRPACRGASPSVSHPREPRFRGCLRIVRTGYDLGRECAASLGAARNGRQRASNGPRRKITYVCCLPKPGKPGLS